VFLDMLALDLPRPAKVTTPVLVVAAERDTFFSRREMQATARAYGAELASFPMAHNMMLEPGWQTVAGHVIDWLERIVGTVAAPAASKGA